MYKAMCCYEGTTPSAVRLLGSGAAQKNSSGKASTSVGMFPGESVERCGCSWFPRRQPQVVGHSSLCARHPARNGHGTAQETDTWMGARVPRFSLRTTVRTESRPRRIAQRTDYAREAEAPGLSSR